MLSTFCSTSWTTPSWAEAALRGLQEIHNEKVISGLAAKVRSTRDKQFVKLITLALFRLYHREAPRDGATWWGHRPNFEGPYVKAVTWEHTPVVKTAIQAAFQKIDPADYAVLFTRMRRNQLSDGDLEFEHRLRRGSVLSR